MSAEVIKMEYASSLADLTMNSKPLIIVLTMLAEENSPNAKIIVEAIEEHLAKAAIDVKLPILYLIDCIVKNVGQTYTNLFSLNLVTTFCNVFKLVDEKTRSEMFKLRQTWNDVFPQMKLYAIDVQIHNIDPAWPVTAQPNSIHLNPKFLKNTTGNQTKPKLPVPTPIIGTSAKPNTSLDKETLMMQEQLIQKQKELLELQKKTLELEVLQTQVKLQEQIKSNTSQMNILLKPEVAKQLIPEVGGAKSKQTNVCDFIVNNQRLPNTNQTGAKINPVNPALVAAAAAAASTKPIRDPRLLRQQHQHDTKEQHKFPKLSNDSQAIISQTTATSSLIQATTGSVAGPTVSDKVAVFENNKNVTNKLSVRDTHKDTRLSNKIEKKSKASSKSSVSYSDFSKNVNHSSNSHKNDKSAPNSKASSNVADSSKSASLSTGKSSSSSFSNESSSSNTSLDLSSSPNKNKNRTSSTRHKKRDRTDHDNGQESTRTNKRGKISVKGDSNNTYYKNTNNDNSSSFKNVKGSNKNRNYMRRNINNSPPEDDYVRTLKTHEKLPSRSQQSDKKNNESIPSTTKPMDVDLRQLSIPINKRRSTETADQTAKKQRSLDTLFGNEDIDLRQMSVPKTDNVVGGGAERKPSFVPPLDRPPTPPPPIISLSSDEQSDGTSPSTTKGSAPVAPAAAQSQPTPLLPKSDLDTVRAKLAHASGWAKVSSKSFHKRKLQNDATLNDFYLRHHQPTSKQQPLQPLIPTTTTASMPQEQQQQESITKSSHITNQQDNHIFKKILLEDPIKLGSDKINENLSENRCDFAKDIIGSTNGQYQDTDDRSNINNNQSVKQQQQHLIFNDKDERIHLPRMPSAAVRLPSQSPTNHEGKIPPPPIPPSHLHHGQFFPMGNDMWGPHFNMPSELNNPMDMPPFISNNNNNLNPMPSLLTSSLTPVAPATVLPQAVAAAVSNPIDVKELYQKLVQSGFVNPNNIQTPKNVPNNNFDTQLLLNPIENVPSNSNSQSEIWSASSLSPISSLDNTLINNPTNSNSNNNNNAIEASIMTMKNNKKAFVSALKPISFAKPHTLRTVQPLLYTVLYSGMQCSSCGMRFSPEASMFYSQHLDWHFRQNRKGKMNAKVASSRKWYYSLVDWKNYEEIEDLEEREKNYFDQQQQAETVEETEDEEIPSVPADPNSTDERCQVCRDTFEQFFNEDKEEWHLRNAIKMDAKTYHPVCYEDYLNSSKEITMDDNKLDTITLSPKNTLIPGLEIILDDDDDDEEPRENSNSGKLDVEKGLEVISLDESQDSNMECDHNDNDKPKEPVQMNDYDDDGDDDDVILNEVAPIKIVVDDDDDDDDDNSQEPLFNRVIKQKPKEEFDDGFVDVGECGLVSLNKVGEIKIKSEPIDHEDELGTASEEPIKNLDDSSVETTATAQSSLASSQQTPVIPVTTHPHMVTSIDGNTELVSSNSSLVPTTISSGKIKINISKPLPVITAKEITSSNSNSSSNSNDNNVNTNKLGKNGIGEEQFVDPEIIHYKPALKDVPLRKMPRVKKGHELTGLCSIM